MDDGKNTSRERCVEVSSADLPLHCPTPDMTLWNSHPRVFLDIEAKGEALCPYCSTRFILRNGPRADPA